MSNDAAARPGVTTLRTDVVTTLGELEGLAKEWHDLVLRSPASTAYASPAWVLPWFRQFERPNSLRVVVARRDAQLVGLAPFATWGFGGGRTGFHLLVSAGTEHGDYGDPLLGDDPVPVAEAIADRLCRLVREESVAVNLRRLREDGPFLPALEARDDVTRQPMGEVAHAAVVDFTRLDDPADHLEKQAKKLSVPRLLRRFHEQEPDVTYRVEDQRIDDALDAMKDQLQRRWDPGTGPRVFSTPSREAFSRSSMRALVEADLGHISTFNVEDRPVAVTTVFKVGNRHSWDNTSFDPDLGRYKLGHAALYEMLRHSLADGAAEVDLRAGDFPYKRKWANAERITRSIVLAAPGKAGAVALAARRVAMSRRARRLGQSA